MNTIKHQPIPKEIKEQVLGRIKQDGVAVYQAANEHGLNPRTIYDWLNKDAAKNMSFTTITGSLNSMRKPKKQSSRFYLSIQLMAIRDLLLSLKPIKRKSFE